MLSERYQILLVPVQISEFVFDNELTKPFSIFLYLKMFAGDKVSAKDEVFAMLLQDLKMIDPKDRTFRKHFQRLLDLNWIGFNRESGIYHIRSFDYIRAINGFKKRRATKLRLQDIKQMQTYLVGVILCNAVYGQKYYWEKVKRRSRAATNQRGVAKQSKAFFHPSRPPYYGLSNHKIACLLGCQYTRACQLKQAATQAGYITVRHRYSDVEVLQKADYNFRLLASEQRPEIAKRLRFWIQFEEGVRIIKVVRQLHDEILPQLEYKRVVAFAALKVPFNILKLHMPDNGYAKAA